MTVPDWASTSVAHGQGFVNDVSKLLHIFMFPNAVKN